MSIEEVGRIAQVLGVRPEWIAFGVDGSAPRPRLRGALERLAAAAEAGRLPESDAALIEQLCDRLLAR